MTLSEIDQVLCLDCVDEDLRVPGYETISDLLD